MTRQRTRSDPMPTGTRTRFGDPVAGGLNFALYEFCEDEVLEGDNYAFTVVRNTITGGVLNSLVPGGFFGTTFDNYPADALGNGQMAPYFVFPDQKPYAMYATEAIARTNPSKPYVDIPVNVLELGDIPLLLKNKGETFLHGLGGGYIKYKFGVEPLVSDAVKMLDFTNQVNKKIGIIERLKGPTGYRKTVDLDYLENSDVQSIAWQTADAFIIGSTKRQASRSIRGHVRWFPDVDFGSIPVRELEGMAKRAVNGMTIDFATLWEAMPWSWLIDWYTNIGQFLAAQRNIIPASLDRCMIIEHSKAESSIPEIESFDHGHHVLSSGKMTWETKKRFHQPGDVSAHFPFLSGDQVGILAALMVTR